MDKDNVAVLVAGVNVCPDFDGVMVNATELGSPLFKSP